MSAAVQLVVQRPTVRVVAGAIPVSTGGASDHDDLGAGSLVWTASAHTGTASRLAGFSGAGAAAYYQIGADVQAYDAGLASLATVDTAADLLPYTTAANTWAATALTAWARTLLDDASRTAALATLGCASIAVVPVSTTDDTNGETFCTIPLVAGKKYLIAGVAGVTTALASTALNTRFTASAGLTLTDGAMSWVTAQTTTQAGGSTTEDVWTSLVSGLGTTPRALVIHGHFTVSGSGDLLLQVRTEISGSYAAVLYGAVRVEEVP